MCLRVSLALSSTPLADRHNLLMGGRARVPNKSGYTLAFKFCIVLGFATRIGGDRKGERERQFLRPFPSAINPRWE